MIEARRILITGGSGQVGTCLQALPWPDDIALVVPDLDSFDLTDPVSVARFIRENPLNAVVNAGAYTAVDKAESEPELAMAANGHGAKVLAQSAADQGLPIIQVSTDYVFDGSKDTPYGEDDPVAPLGIYGKSKLAGEKGVLESGARAIILRTAWVLSPHGHNFLKTMLRLAEERDTVSVVDDQIGNPTSAIDIANVLQSLILTMVDDPTRQTGIYHFTNAGETSWHGLAAHIFDRLNAEGHTAPALNAISTTDYPTPARRPANSRLDTSKITADFAVTPRSWQSAVDDILDILLKD
ncbi:MAG: dTDP-4-dehydrorhamnose reductase [Pseudomonadota bacterium]